VNETYKNTRIESSKELRKKDEDKEFKMSDMNSEKTRINKQIITCLFFLYLYLLLCAYL
jgi:hypothetical protein